MDILSIPGLRILDTRIPILPMHIIQARISSTSPSTAAGVPRISVSTVRTLPLKVVRPASLRATRARPVMSPPGGRSKRQIDISGVYEGPGGGTYHNFFTTGLQFVSKKLLSDTQHNGFSSMITLGAIPYFLSSRAEMAGAPWSVIVMQYNPSWTYLGVKTLREHAATPQGLAFDGTWS